MSSQDVCLDMDLDGDTSFSRSRMVRARKSHVCVECHGAIAIGESYEYATGKSDNYFWDSKTCAVCTEIRKAFVCGAFVIGALWDEIRDQIFPHWDEMVAIDCLAKLSTDAAMAKMRAEYTRCRDCPR